VSFRDLLRFWVYRGRALVVGALLAGSSCLGQEIHLESAGARFGFYSWGAGHEFHQAEGFVNAALPWTWDLGSRWVLDSRADFSAGWLGESGSDAAVITGGVSLVLRKLGWPLSFDCGGSPTFISRSDFRNKDLGSLLQFTSHGCINFDITRQIRLSYRFQHMSNAGLGRHNPGLNLQMIGLSYVF
jgi:hypothetical protein